MTKLYAPAPATASVRLTTALKTKPTAIAFMSLSCWKRRWITPTETAVMPSRTIVRVSSRTSGVASGLPAASARTGAPTQNSAYQARLKAMAMVRRRGRHLLDLAAPLHGRRDHAHVVHVDEEGVGRQRDGVEAEVVGSEQADHDQAQGERADLEDQVAAERPARARGPPGVRSTRPRSRSVDRDLLRPSAPCAHLLISHEEAPARPAPARSRATSTRTRAGSWR